ncbi:MAG: patatin family protein [Clostridia bacterium]|nr:patatin family protein [Clostridia bacterium]
MKLGMVMEGGGMRALYTAGVQDQLMNLELPVSEMIGVSAGALYGINYASKQKGRVPRYLKKYAGDSRFMGFGSLLREGNIVSKDFAYYEVPMKLDPFDEKAFEESGVDFFVVLTDVLTGKPEYVQIKNGFKQMEALRATSSMPFVSKVIRYGNGLYLDGGMSDSIPVDYMLRRGCDKLIVILTRDSSYRKKIPGKAVRAVIRFWYREYPELARALINRARKYNHMLDRVAHLEQEGRIFVIRPSSEISIGRLEKDPIKLQGVYDLGRKDGQASIRELLRYIES